MDSTRKHLLALILFFTIMMTAGVTAQSVTITQDQLTLSDGTITGDYDLDSLGENTTMSTNLDMNGSYIYNISDPLGPTYVANRRYVKNQVSSIDTSTETPSLDSVLSKGNDAGNLAIINLDNSTKTNAAVTYGQLQEYVETNNADGDSDPLNEIQNLTEVLAEGTNADGKIIVNYGNPSNSNTDAVADVGFVKTYVSNNKQDGDASSTNELQDLSSENASAPSGASSVSHKVNITDGQNAVIKDYYVPSDGGTDDQNLQATTRSGQTVTIPIENGADTSFTDRNGTDNQTLAQVLSEGSDAGSTAIINLDNSTSAQAAVTYSQLQDYVESNNDDGDSSSTNELQNLKEVLAQGDVANQSISMDGHTITGLPAPSNGGDAVNKSYVDSQVSQSGSDNQELTVYNNTDGVNDAVSIDNGNNVTIEDNYEPNTDNQNLSEVLVEDNDAGSVAIVGLDNSTSAQAAVTYSQLQDYVSSNNADGDSDSTNEIQNLTEVLGQGNNANSTLIVNYGNPTGNNDNVVADVGYVKDYVSGSSDADADADPENELQNLSVDNSSTNDVIEINSGDDSATYDSVVIDDDVNPVEADLVADNGLSGTSNNVLPGADSDITISLASSVAGTQLNYSTGTLSVYQGSGSGLNADLIDGVDSGSLCRADGTNCPSDETGTDNQNLQAVTRDGQTVTIPIEGGDNTSFTDENGTDDQALGTSGDEITLDNGGSIKAPYADDADKLDGVQLASINWSDVELDESHISASDVGLSNVRNIDLSDTGGSYITYDAANEEFNVVASNMGWNNLGIDESDVNVSHLGSADSNLNMGESYRITNMDNASNAQDATTLSQVNSIVSSADKADADSDTTNELQNLSVDTSGTDDTITIDGGDDDTEYESVTINDDVNPVEADLVAGDGLSGTSNDVLPGSDADVSLSLASSVAGTQLNYSTGTLSVYEGSGSGLNADTVDGVQPSDLAGSGITWDTSNSELDAVDTSSDNEIQNLTEVLGQGANADSAVIDNYGTPGDSNKDAVVDVAWVENYVSSASNADADADSTNELQNLSVDTSSTDDVIKINSGDSSTVRDSITIQDDYASDNQGLGFSDGNPSISNSVNHTITIDDGVNTDIKDYFEADTDAESQCSSGQVLTGSGCTSRYGSEDDGDSSTGNEGLSSASFSTSNGDLTLNRQTQSSVTVNLDGRYAQSDTTDDSVEGSELDNLFSSDGLLKRTGSNSYSTISDSSGNWDTAYSERGSQIDGSFLNWGGSNLNVQTGTFVSGDGSGNLDVDIGTGLQDDGSGNIEVDEANVNINNLQNAGDLADEGSVSSGQIDTDAVTSTELSPNIAYTSTIAADSFTSTEVSNLRGGSLDDGTTPWTSNNYFDATDARNAVEGTSDLTDLSSGQTGNNNYVAASDGSGNVNWDNPESLVHSKYTDSDAQGAVSKSDVGLGNVRNVDLSNTAGSFLTYDSNNENYNVQTGTFISGDGSGNLDVDIGNGLQDDGSGNIEVNWNNANDLDSSGDVSNLTDVTTDDLSEGSSNQYYTTSRARGDVRATDVGLGSVEDIAQSNMAGKNLSWDSTNKEIDFSGTDNYIGNSGAHKAGDNLDMNGNNITDGKKGNVSFAQDIKVYGNMYTSGADLAEMYKSEQELEAGDVVSVSSSKDDRAVRSDEKYDEQVLGVVSTEPGQVINSDVDGHPIALNGKVPVKVSEENGEIRRGDRIVPSSEPGKGMRCETIDPMESDKSLREIVSHNEDCRSSSIGKALEPSDGSGTVLVAVE